MSSAASLAWTSSPARNSRLCALVTSLCKPPKSKKTDVVLSYVEEGKGKKKSFGFLDEHGATVDFDLVDSKERQELLAAKIADKDAEFDFEVTVVSAPVAVGAVADDEDLHLKLVHAVYQWKAVRGE